jgi:hypothetical protein
MVKTKMTNKLEHILVIEDTPSHLAEAKKFLETVRGLRTEYAITANEAIGELGSGGKLYVAELGEDNPRWYSKMETFRKQNNLPKYPSPSTDEQLRAIQEYGRQLETQGVPRTIGRKITPLVDGVITDLFFPMGENLIAEINQGPSGLIVAATCQRLKIPYVICTAGYHHGSKYEWANLMHRAMGGPEMIDCYNSSNPNTEAKHKNWEAAYEALRKIVEGKNDIHR